MAENKQKKYNTPYFGSVLRNFAAQGSQNVIKNGQVDLGNITEDKKPIPDVVIPERTPVAVPDFVSAPQDASQEPITPQEDPRVKLQAEIDTLGREIAKKEERRTTEFQDTGVFDDVRRLNELKAQLRTAEDKQIEIPIRERQALRGQGATKTEFSQTTRPKLEDAALEALTASRAASALTDVIATNMSIIDQRLKAEFDEKAFVFEQKVSKLDKLEKLHSDIMSANQKAALEAQKFKQQIQLESFKADNSLKGDLLKELVKKGVSGPQLQGLASGSINDILTFQAEQRSVNNWDTMTFEEALRVLPDDELKRFERYKKLDPDSKAAARQGIDAMQGANHVISLMESMLNDKEGLANSVGLGLGNRDFNFFGAGNESSVFRANAKTLISAQTLETLKNLKKTGATLGAISEKELNILINAQQSLGAVIDGDTITGRFELDEGAFKTELKTMRMAAMKTYVAASMGADAYAAGGFLNLDAENEGDYATISNLYHELKGSGVADYSNELKQ